MSTTDLAQQVADLTSATTALTQEVVGQKDRLTAAADTATSKASEASASEQAAQSHKDSANSSALAAEQSKNQAAEITGLDTVEDAIDLTLAQTAGLMTESEARAINRMNETKYAASGMVHMGKHETKNAIVNEGIAVYSGSGSNVAANTIRIGATSGSSLGGTSKTGHSVTHIAGAIANILAMGTPSKTGLFELPEVEDGTRIYDSTGDARGSGKASLDLKVDVDPKYGDVPTGTDAQIIREAVGRAFEGDVKNGDFRLGDNGDWNNYLNYAAYTITDGVLTITNSTNAIGGVQSDQYSVEDGEEYVVGFYLHSGTVRLRRTITPTSHNPSNEDLGAFNTPGYHEVRYTAPTGYTSNSMWFETVTISDLPSFSNVSIRKVTEEVVTHPVDLIGLEYYEEELTGRQEIFECIQSLSTTFGDTDVPTVLSTRPLSYFQQYDGQFADPTAQNDRYRCVVWSDLTDEQKRKVAAYMGEKLFMGVNGKMVNGRLRARTFRGGKNGDWNNVDSTKSGGLTFGTGGLVKPQGVSDTPNGTMYVEPTSGVAAIKDTPKGAFIVRDNATFAAYQGRCFMYVVATVPRLNDGFYHENLNPYGSVADLNGKKWYETTFDFETTADCFDRSKISHD